MRIRGKWELKRYDTNDNEKSPEGGGYLPATY